MRRSASLRKFSGPVRAVVADLAGTTVDFGSCAPAGAFMELFRRRGIALSPEEVRGPMGTHEMDHIRALASLPRVASEWRELHAGDWAEADIESLYREFIPLQLEVLPRFNVLVPGTLEAIGYLAGRGIPVAVTTGYNRKMLEIVHAGCRAGGFEPAAAVCGDDVPRGRPAPWMIFRAMELLGAFPPEAVISIGDTLADAEAGRNAGTWTVGVVRTGNLVGLHREELERLDAREAEARCARAREALEKAGCHYTVDGIGDLPRVVEEIGTRLASGEVPWGVPVLSHHCAKTDEEVKR
jgi:phosphonoacetaldehyde hydrolase